MDDEHTDENLSEWAKGFGHGRISAGTGGSGPPSNPYVPRGDHSDPYQDGWKTGFAFSYLANEILRGLRNVAEAQVN